MATQVYDFPQGFSGGMNISVSSDQISPNSSPSMENCSYDEGGIPGKRMGFSRTHAITLGPTPIRDMVEFAQIGQATEFLVICGGGLFKQN